MTTDITMKLAVVVAGLLAALTSNIQCQQIDCKLSDSNSLNHCLKTLLESARAKVRVKADPLRLDDHREDEFQAWNIRIQGLSGYNVEHISVAFPQNTKIAVKAAISWPGISGDLSVRVKKCKRIIKKVCVSASAEPHVSLARTVGSLDIVLDLILNNDGSVRVIPQNTQVKLVLPKIHVKVNLKNKVTGLINRILGDPASRIATRLANKWWNNNRSKVEAKARQSLEEVVKKDVSADLSRLLRQ